MVHTLELFRKISHTEYYYLDRALKTLSKKLGTTYFNDNPQNDDVKIYKCFTYNGITITLRKKYLGNDITYRKIQIELNPKRLQIPGEFIEVSSQENLININKTFKKIMKELRVEYNRLDKYAPKFIFDLLEKYTVKRVDYSVNIFHEHYLKMMELIIRSDIPNKFQPFLKYDSKAKRKVMPKHSFYLTGKSKSVIINIYSKYDQMKEDEYFKDMDISKAKGILRFEIQCMSQKVDNIRKLYKLKNKTFFDIATNEIAEDILVYYLERTMGLEDYHTLKLARKKVNENGSVRKKTKEEMIKLLEFVNEKRSIPKARRSFSEGEKRFDILLEKIKKIGVNPVTIPINWGIDYLPNPIHEIIRHFVP